MTTNNSYFSVSHYFTVYLEPWNDAVPLPNLDSLTDLQSTGLKLINEVKELESSCLFQLRQMEINAKPIVDYLKLQSQKIDLVLQFMLEQETHHGKAYEGVQFGGSGFTITAAESVANKGYYKATLCMRDELINVLCIAQVGNCHKQENQANSYDINFDFAVIQQTDIEQLVQASLKVQRKLLHTKQTKTSKT